MNSIINASHTLPLPPHIAEVHLLIRDQCIVSSQPDSTHFSCGWVYVCLCWLWNGMRCQDSFDVVGATGSLQSRPLFGARLISLLIHTHILSSLHSVPYSQVECVFSYHTARRLLNTFAPAISITHQIKWNKSQWGRMSIVESSTKTL